MSIGWSISFRYQGSICSQVFSSRSCGKPLVGIRLRDVGRVVNVVLLW